MCCRRTDDPNGATQLGANDEKDRGRFCLVWVHAVEEKCGCVGTARAWRTLRKEARAASADGAPALMNLVVNSVPVPEGVTAWQVKVPAELEAGQTYCVQASPTAVQLEVSVREDSNDGETTTFVGARRQAQSSEGSRRRTF